MAMRDPTPKELAAHKQRMAARSFDRLAVLFSGCPGNNLNSHQWNLDTNKCTHCGREYPMKD
jgi:hypothetical protein